MNGGWTVGANRLYRKGEVGKEDENEDEDEDENVQRMDICKPVEMVPL